MVLLLLFMPVYLISILDWKESLSLGVAPLSKMKGFPMPVAVDDVPLDIILVRVENLSTDKSYSCHLELRV